MYVYRHQNGTYSRKVDFVVDSGNGPDVYFDSPLVSEWKHFDTDLEVKKWITEDRIKHPKIKDDKATAREAVSRALANGTIIKPDFCCIKGCKSTDICGYHYDYSLHLDVIWICRPHHALYHYIDSMIGLKQLKNKTLIDGIEVYREVNEIITKLK